MFEDGRPTAGCLPAHPVPVPAAMPDIDFFKKINDTLGQGFGDQEFQTVARQLKQHSRAGDIVGRYGGEEFAFAAGGLNAAIADTSVVTDARSAAGHPASVGLAQPGLHNKLGGLLGRADGAL